MRGKECGTFCVSSNGAQGVTVNGAQSSTITITWERWSSIYHECREESLVGLCGYGRWSGGRGMASGLEDEDYYEPKDEEQEKEDALPPASILLVPVERRNQKEKEGEK